MKFRPQTSKYYIEHRPQATSSDESKLHGAQGRILLNDNGVKATASSGRDSSKKLKSHKDNGAVNIGNLPPQSQTSLYLSKTASKVCFCSMDLYSGAMFHHRGCKDHPKPARSCHRPRSPFSTIPSHHDQFVVSLLSSKNTFETKATASSKNKNNPINYSDRFINDIDPEAGFQTNSEGSDESDADMVEKEETYNSSGVKGECLDDPSTDTDDQKDAHRSCTEWDHCERCRDTKYSFAAVIARLEREAKKEARQQKKLQQRILWERTDEALLDRRIKFCKRFGIDAYKFEVTPGEKRLARDTILGKWQCKSRSPLRKCWTMVRYQAKQGSRSLRK